MEETGFHWSDKDWEQKVIDEVNNLKLKSVGKDELLKWNEPCYGISINASGYGDIWLTYSDGLWLTNDSSLYRGEFDLEKCFDEAAGLEGTMENSFDSGILMPNAAILSKYDLKYCHKASNEVYTDSVEKLPQVGKLKNVDGVLIEIYMKYHDKLSVGDKLSSNANKHVLMDVYKDSEAPYTDFRPDEAIDLCASCSALDGRMITSIIKIGALNKVMIELHRSVCDIMDIKWDTIHEIKDKNTK